MVIKRSSAREVATLLAALEGDDRVARETAVARLSVIGTRAVDGLLRTLTASQLPSARAAALTALDAIDDPRVVGAAFTGLGDVAPEPRAVAVGMLHRLLESRHDREVLDRLVPIALDKTATDPVRLAALDALSGLPPEILHPLEQALATDESTAVRERVASTPHPTASPKGSAAVSVVDIPDASAVLLAAAERDDVDDPDDLRQAVNQVGADVPLTTLHRLVERIRARESAVGHAPARLAWMTARSAVHQVLASRGSTVALYDLRDTIESADTGVPVEMLAAIETIGDRSCLEPIAAAFVRLSGKDDGAEGGRARRGSAGTRTWWRDHLAVAFRAIVARENLGERSPLTKRIRSRWPEAAKALFGR